MIKTRQHLLCEIARGLFRERQRFANLGMQFCLPVKKILLMRLVYCCMISEPWKIVIYFIETMRPLILISGRQNKNDLHLSSEALNIFGVEALYIFLKRFTYSCHYTWCNVSFYFPCSPTINDSKHGNGLNLCSIFKLTD